MKAKLLELLGIALLAGPIAAHCAPLKYDFTVNGGPSGPVAGPTATGTFTLDSSIIPATGGVTNATGLLTDPPEPDGMTLFAVGLGLLLSLKRRRRARPKP